MGRLNNDILGLAVHDCYFNGSEEPILVKLNGVNDEPYNPKVFLRSYIHLKAWEKKALGLCNGSVLDVGAGAGTHALLLQKRGMDVTALEKSPLMCEVMRDRGVERIINDSILNVKGIEFNTILLFMNGLGMMGSEEETLILFKHLKKLLAKGGQIIGDSTDILYATMNAANATASNQFYGQVEFELTYKKQKGEKFPWLYLDPVLLTELTEKAGLRSEIIHRDPGFHFLARITKD
jgi:SAM-dependent methyltransferase